MKKYWLGFLTVLSSACHPQALEDKEIIHIQTTRCYGTCPVYQLTLHPNGEIDFDGQRFTSKQGQAHKKVSIDIIEKIITQLATYRPETGTTMDNENCTNPATDHPGFIITWQNGTNKTIRNHYTGCHSEDNQQFTDFLYHLPVQLKIQDWLKYEQIRIKQ